MKTGKMKQIISILIFCFLHCLPLVLSYDPATCIECRKSHVCNPPDCFCCRDKMPLEKHKIPQMVFFTFDDAVTPQVAAYYRELFESKRKNPNGCPISMTLFISHSNTVYKLVREFYDKGMEIASHSVTHSHPNPQTFMREARKQRENLAKNAKIPEKDIVGWRSPFLEPLGDTQPSVLKQLGYEYDATLTITKKNSNDNAITPFTLDYGWPYDCKIKSCPSKPHKGFWEVPVVSVKDYLNKYDCVYVDGCNNPPPSENLAFKFLWDNFQQYYTTNRAPMGINMHASWFYYPNRKKAMDRFIQELVKLDDVYIISVKQVIAWLKDPTPLHTIKTFPPWQCDGVSPTAPRKRNSKVIGTRKNKQTQSGTPNIDRTQYFQKMAEQRNQWRRQQIQRERHRMSTFQNRPVIPSVPPTPANSRRPPIPPLVPNHPMINFWWQSSPSGAIPPDVQHQLEMRRRNMQMRQMEQERRQLEIQRRAQEQKRLQMIKQQQEDERTRQLLLKQQEEQKRQLLLKEQEEKKRLQLLEQQEKKKRQQLLQQQEEQKRQKMLKQQEEQKRQQLLKQQEKQHHLEEAKRKQDLHRSKLAEQHRHREAMEKIAAERSRTENLKQQTNSVVNKASTPVNNQGPLTNSGLFVEYLPADGSMNNSPVISNIDIAVHQPPLREFHEQTLAQEKLKLHPDKVNKEQLQKDKTASVVQSQNNLATKAKLSDPKVIENNKSPKAAAQKVYDQQTQMSTIKPSLFESHTPNPDSHTNTIPDNRKSNFKTNSQILDNILKYKSDARVKYLHQLSLGELKSLQAELRRRLESDAATGNATKSRKADTKSQHTDITSAIIKQDTTGMQPTTEMPVHKMVPNRITEPPLYVPNVHKMVPNRITEPPLNVPKIHKMVPNRITEPPLHVPNVHKMVPNRITEPPVNVPNVHKMVPNRTTEPPLHVPNVHKMVPNRITEPPLHVPNVHKMVPNRITEPPLHVSNGENIQRASLTISLPSFSKSPSIGWNNNNGFNRHYAPETTTEFPVTTTTTQAATTSAVIETTTELTTIYNAVTDAITEVSTDNLISTVPEVTPAMGTTTTDAPTLPTQPIIPTEPPVLQTTSRPRIVEVGSKSLWQISDIFDMSNRINTGQTKAGPVPTQSNRMSALLPTKPKSLKSLFSVGGHLNSNDAMSSARAEFVTAPLNHQVVDYKEPTQETNVLFNDQTPTSASKLASMPAQYSKSLFKVSGYDRDSHVIPIGIRNNNNNHNIQNQVSLHIPPAVQTEIARLTIESRNKTRDHQESMSVKYNFATDMQTDRALPTEAPIFETKDMQTTPAPIQMVNRPFQKLIKPVNMFQNNFQPLFGSAQTPFNPQNSNNNNKPTDAKPFNPQNNNSNKPSDATSFNPQNNNNNKPSDATSFNPQNNNNNNKPNDIVSNTIPDLYTSVNDNNGMLNEADFLIPLPGSNRTPGSKCQQEVNCYSPDCVCKTETTPNNIPVKQIPQIVYITIDGSLNFHAYSKIRQLFLPKRVNPNGCRIKGTLFVTDAGSNYRIADLLHGKGLEIGLSGLSSRPQRTATELEESIVTLTEQITSKTKVSPIAIKGWRTPGFKPIGDAQYEILSNYSLYDSSLVTDRNNEQAKLWPFTLDFGWKEDCGARPCPSGYHPGVMEVPIMPFMGPGNSTACEYTDGCTKQPGSAQKTLDYLMNNFNAYYKTNRAPFAIRLKQIWFHWYYRSNLGGLIKFLDKILGYKDVYVTSVSDMLDWVRDPVPLNQLDTFQPWKC